MKRFSIAFILFLSTIINVSAITAREIVDRIIKKTTGKELPKTVDVFKEGSPDTEVKGIAVCMFATMDVLRDAVKNNCNFIITHEPIYYNGPDDTTQLKNDPVVAAKRKFIRDNNLVIWRFHDYLHASKPDATLIAMSEKLGWKNYAVTPHFEYYKIPETTLKGVIKHLKAKFPGVKVDVVGNLNAKISKVSFLPGSPGRMYHITYLTAQNADLVITGEVEQWETYEYVRDAIAQGKNKSIVFLGHIPSEDPGIVYAQNWLKGFITEVPVMFLECGLSYKTF